MSKYEIEDEAGGYVRNGDVLEWHWKEAEKETSPPPAKPEAETGPPAKKRGRPKKKTGA